MIEKYISVIALSSGLILAGCDSLGSKAPSYPVYYNVNGDCSGVVSSGNSATRSGGVSSSSQTFSPDCSQPVVTIEPPAPIIVQNPPVTAGGGAGGSGQGGQGGSGGAGGAGGTATTVPAGGTGTGSAPPITIP